MTTVATPRADDPSPQPPNAAHSPRTGSPEAYPQPLTMRFPLPASRSVDRAEYLVQAVRGKRLIHVGFADNGMRSYTQASGDWLHGALAVAARETVGLDQDVVGVAEAVQAGLDARAVDCCDRDAVEALGIEPADVVIAGEVIEHVDAVGPFLDAMHALVRPDGILIITTPNAMRLRNLVTVLRVEHVHPDHVCWFSWHTLATALERRRWEVSEVLTYMQATSRPVDWTRPRWLIGGAFNTAMRYANRTVTPFLADGLIAVARPAIGRSEVGPEVR